MSKNYLQLMLILLISGSLGCRQKEEFTKLVPDRSGVRKIIVDEAKSWYLSVNKKSSVSGKTMSANTGSTASNISVIGEPNWNVSNTFSLADTIVVIKVPLINYVVNNAYTASMNPVGYRELVFQKNISGAVTGHVLEVHPDLAYLQQQKQNYPSATLTDYAILVKNENFTGFVLTFNLNNQLLSGQHKTNGVTDRTIQPN